MRDRISAGCAKPATRCASGGDLPLAERNRSSSRRRSSSTAGPIDAELGVTLKLLCVIPDRRCAKLWSTSWSSPWDREGRDEGGRSACCCKKASSCSASPCWRAMSALSMNMSANVGVLERLEPAHLPLLAPR